VSRRWTIERARGFAEAVAALDTANEVRLAVLELGPAEGTSGARDRVGAHAQHEVTR